MNRPQPTLKTASPFALVLAFAFAMMANVAAQDGESKTDSSADQSAKKKATLPWKKKKKAAPKSLGPRLSSAREILSLSGIDESQLNQFYNERPLHPDEDETLLKLLFRIPQLGQDKIEQWRKKDVDWSNVAEKPTEHRAEFMAVKGRAKTIEKVSLPDQIAKKFEYKHYYRLQFALDNAPNPVMVCCREVPQAWTKGATLDERSAFDGLFLKTGDISGEHPELVFATRRVAWLPDREQPENGITGSHVWLGELGMDVSRFDDVKRTNRKGLGGLDREAFYQLLAATQQADAAEYLKRAKDEFDLAPMLTKPEEQHGRLIDFVCTARRVQRIRVSDPDIRQRFGIDYYFQVDSFIPLGKQDVRLGKKGDKDAPVIRNNYPVTCCMLKLPDGLEEAEDVDQDIRVAGFYFKLWAYKTEFISRYDKKQRQLSPMFITATPKVVPRKEATALFDPKDNPILGWVCGIGFVAMLVGLSFGVYLFNRSDKKFSQNTLQRQRSMEEGTSLNEMKIEAQDGPDFSGLD